MPLENDFSSAELLELLRFRDQAHASAAEESERKIRYSLLKERLHQIETELPTLLRFRDQAHASAVKEDELRENMTRAYNAEKKVLEMRSDIDRLITKHQSEIALIRSSRTWRIGHFILMPLRLLRALKRS